MLMGYCPWKLLPFWASLPMPFRCELIKVSRSFVASWHKSIIMKKVKHIEHLFEKTKDIRLAPEKKESIRLNIIQFIESHPMVAGGVAGLPDQSGPIAKSPWHWALPRPFSWSKVSISFAALLFLFGGAVSFAAESALPGDTLYPVKRGFNE